VLSWAGIRQNYSIHEYCLKLISVILFGKQGRYILNLRPDREISIENYDFNIAVS